MSRLPQRRKTSEEIAKLRESLGIPGQTPEEQGLPAGESPGDGAPSAPLDPPPMPEPVADLSEGEKNADAGLGPVAVLSPVPDGNSTGENAEKEIPSQPMAPIPVLDPPEGFDPHEPHAFNEKHVHHDADPGTVAKRGAPIPVLPIEDEPVLHERSVAATEPKPSGPLPVTRLPRAVKSLRKSEQGPVLAPPPPPVDSPLPKHRHSDREIAEIRRHEMLSQFGPKVNPMSMVAHPVMVVPGYLFALAGGACFLYYDFEMPYMAVCSALALVVAAFIFFKKPLSKHHAAFIVVLALLVIVFGMLHYYPSLRFQNGA